MSSQPTVSVIMPAYNAESTIAAALDSLLGQTRPVQEIIVVDDGSVDATAQIVVGYGDRVRLVWQPNSGPPQARNHGLTLATGEWLAFLDADDLWPPDSLSALVDGLVTAPTAEIVQGYLQDMWPGQGQAIVLDPPRRSFNLGSALFRREVFTRVGPFEPGLRQGEDIDFWVRCREQGIVMRTVEHVTLFYRRKPNADPRARDQYYSRLLHSVKRSLDRRRGRG